MVRHSALIKLPPTNAGEDGREGRGLTVEMMVCVLRVSPMSDWTKGCGLEYQCMGTGSVRADMNGPARLNTPGGALGVVVPALVVGIKLG